MRTVAYRRIPIVAVLALLLLPSCGIWDYFSAYFNTYYNAQHDYAEAVEDVWSMPDTKETGRNMLVTMNISATAKAKFTSVIEKCSKLLQYHPDASLVDDALMMIGRSYYYQNEFQKAERKFKELLDGYPKSSLALEAQVLLSFSYYKSADRDNAAKTAQQALEKATASGDNTFVAEAALVLGQMALDDKAYAKAREYFARVGEFGDSSEKRSQALMKVAEMYAQEGEFVSAEEAYGKAFSLSKSYLGEYRARIGMARMLDRQHRYEAAHQALLLLRANSNYREFYGDIDFEIGNVARDRGDVLSALSQYAYVDTAYARTEASADANLALGMLYETVLMQYDSARAVYDRGRQAVNTSAARAKIVRRADYLARYITYRNDIIKLDSLREVALHPADTLAAQRDSLTARKDSLIAQATAVKSDTSAAGRIDTTRPRLPVAPPLSLDTINVRLAGRMDDIAGLFYATIGLRDSARFWYRRLLAEFPGYRAVPRALYVLARIESEDSTHSHASVDSLYRDLIVRFPESPFAEEAKRILGLPATVKAQDPMAVSYANATSLLQNGMGAAAIDSFKAIVRSSPSSVFAPRAQYAVGWTYEYQVQQMDSAAANYERLVALYPGTVYAQRVQPRVAEMLAARQAALAPKKPDTTAVVPTVKKPDKVPELPDEERMSKRPRAKPATGSEKTDTPIEIPDDRVLR